jgi:hypothetical protein
MKIEQKKNKLKVYLILDFEYQNKPTSDRSTHND